LPPATVKDPMTRVARVAFLAIVSIALQLQAQAPVPQATFRGGTDLVQVDVSVLDGRRHPVRGLTAQDFTISEDGQPRDIQAFTEVDLPDRLQPRDASWTREVPGDVATNRAAQEEGRLVIILLDRTIPIGEPTLAARRIAAAAIGQLGPGDLAAVVSTSNGAVQNLTSDHARLLRAISDSDLSTDISDEAKEIEAQVFQLTGRTWSTLNDGRCQCGLCVPDTIARVADAVQGTSRRRKVLLFIGSDLLLQTAGSPGGASNDVGCEKRLRDAREAMFTAVDRANLTIHSLDPAGLVNVSPVTKPSSTLRAGPGLAAAITAATNDNLQRQGNLQVLPDRTGGRAVLNTNGPDLAVPDIFRESDSYYLIGFRPADPDVTVPDFAGAPLSLSNIVIGATAGTLTAPRDFLSPLLPVVPTAQREFARADRFVAFFRIYQGTGRQDPLAAVQLQSTIVDARGAVVATETSTLDAAQFATARTADHYVTLPLATLAQGDYLLKVESTMGPRVAGRAMRFIVRP
jgi:VWFA-related protein